MADEGYQPFPDISAWTAVPFDPTTYDQYAALLAQARETATEEDRERAVRTAIRYAGTDTGAIEGLYTTDRGFTRTVAIEAAHWEAAANERGPNAAAIIKDQIEAYEWVLDLATQKTPVTEHLIRELHAMLCRSQGTYVVHTEVGPQERPLPKGEYKKDANNPTSLATGRLHHYAPPGAVAPEMHRLVESLKTEAYARAHPVVQAAYLHYSLVAIHPFADGNGRVTRALASVPLYRALRVPLVVFRDQRDEYLDTLEQADAGDLRPFVAFVAERVVDVIDVVRATIRVGPAADATQSLGRLAKAVLTLGGHTHEEMDALADRLLDAFFTETQDQLAKLSLPAGVDVAVHLGAGHLGAGGPIEYPGYRPTLPGTRAAILTGKSAPPAKAVSSVTVRAYLATGDGRPPLALVCPVVNPLEFSLREVEPQVRDVAHIKMTAWCERLLSHLLAELAEEAEKSLAEQGYR